MRHLIEFTGSTRRLAALVAGTTDDQLDDPTPSGLTVRQLLGHVHDLAAAWRNPAAWEGATRVGGLQMPGGAAAVVGLAGRDPGWHPVPDSEDERGAAHRGDRQAGQGTAG